MSNSSIIDFGFLEELSGGDPKYKYELLSIFLSTVPDGVANLDRLVQEGKDYEAMFKQAHALKSSFGIIKINGVHEGMLQIEALARAIHEKRAEDVAGDKEKINAIFNDTHAIFQEALPALIETRDKNKPPDLEETES